jgi:hypothetical protein
MLPSMVSPRRETEDTAPMLFRNSVALTATTPIESEGMGVPDESFDDDEPPLEEHELHVKKIHARKTGKMKRLLFIRK